MLYFSVSDIHFVYYICMCDMYVCVIIAFHVNFSAQVFELVEFNAYRILLKHVIGNTKNSVSKVLVANKFHTKNVSSQFLILILTKCQLRVL